MQSIQSFGLGLTNLISPFLTDSVTGVFKRDTVCINSPSTRQCWKDSFDISTNYDVAFPITGRTVTVCILVHMKRVFLTSMKV
jgi:hypothetical protein